MSAEIVKLNAAVRDAMGNFIDRTHRASRMSGVKAPTYLKEMRENYSEHARALGNQSTRSALAHRVLTLFIDAAQAYLEQAVANTKLSKRWTAYEDQRLRKSIARLSELLVESQKWEAMRRLRSPVNQLVQLVNGQKITLTDMTHTPLYDSFVVQPQPQPVAHEVLIAAGLYRR